MIQEVVARRDLRKHLAHFPRSVRFRLRAFRASSLGGSGSFRHGLVRNRRRNEEQSAKRARPPPAARHHTKRPCRCVASERIAVSRGASSCPSASPQATPALERAATPAAAPCVAPAKQFAKRRRRALRPSRVPATQPPSCPTPRLPRAGSACNG